MITEYQVSQVKALYKNFTEEFKTIIPTLNLNPQFLRLFREGCYPKAGQKREQTSHSFQIERSFAFDSMMQVLRSYINKVESSRDLYNFLRINNFWSLEFMVEFEQAFINQGSTGTRLLAGFITRNFEINNYYPLISDQSFEIAFDELIKHFSNARTTITTFMSLHGPNGSLQELQLSDNVFLRKAGVDLSKKFCLFYSFPETCTTELYEDDFLLEVIYEIGNKEFLSIHPTETKLLDKWFQILTLLKTGNIQRGNILRFSSGWPLVTLKAPSQSYLNSNPYDYHFKSTYVLNDRDKPDILSIILSLKDVHFSSLDKQIRYSMERLSKAKKTRNIDDRIVELALAFEFLINTSAMEVTLQLCLKAIKILDDQNTNELVYKDLKRFYSLRSKVMHGNDKIDATDNNLLIIDKAEHIIQRLILRLSTLNQKYSFDKISKTLDKALYINIPFQQLIDEV